MAAVTTVRADELASLVVFAGVPADDPVELAANLEPVRARRGEVLMRRGECAVSFLIIASGQAEVRHTGSDGVTAVAELSPGLIVGEIAQLRHAPRTATVIATEELCGYLGYERASGCLLEMPNIAEKLRAHRASAARRGRRTYPIRVRDGTEPPVHPGAGIHRVPCIRRVRSSSARQSQITSLGAPR